MHSDVNDKEGVCYFFKIPVPNSNRYRGWSKDFSPEEYRLYWGGRKKKLGSEDQLIGKESAVALIDETMKRHPLAVINIDCPFFQGQTEVLCMDDTLYDWVIGSIDGSRLPDMSHFSVGVITRVQAKQGKVYRKLKVPDQILSENKEAFQDAQIHVGKYNA